MHKVLRFENDIEVIAPDDGSAVRYSEEAVKRVEDFFSLLVFGQNEWAGQPFVLLPWERQAIRSFYGVQVQDEDGLWVRYRRYLYTELPKKNGKSELSAGLGLYHLLADGEMRPHVGVFAADKTNADIIYQAAKYMVEHTAMSQPEHAPLVWCRDSVREIRTRSGGILKVYSADADTKHGYSFSAIIFDELHAQPNRRLWDVLTAGSNAARRQQAVIVLTTAGDDPDRRSIGWEIHEKCRRILEWRSQVFHAAAAEQNLYFLSRATKSTKKCPSRDLCRADDAERLEPRGVPAADSFPCRGNVPGASISLREDDAGPCDSRQRREYGQADVGSVAPQGPAEGGTAAGAAARAGQFTCPSEYEIEGAPAKLERSELSGVDAGPCGECGVEKEAAPMSMVREAQSPAAASRPCPDFSYTNPSYAKNSPQQNKEQENTKQEQHNPPKSPLWAERDARERHFDPALESAVLSWLRYKSERGEMYKPTGLQTLLKRIENKASAFGAAAVVDIIEQSMSANWQGIVWDKLKKSAPAAPVRRFWE